MSTAESWIALVLVGLVPVIGLALTSFVKFSVVLSLLRNALGAPEAPSALVVMSLSLILTFFVMAPVGLRMMEAAGAPAEVVPGAGGQKQQQPGQPTNLAPAAGEPPSTVAKSTPDFGSLVPATFRPHLPAIERAIEPLRGFLAKHAHRADRESFTKLAGELGRPATGDEVWVLAPAFVVSELKEAFAIAVLVFIPFLVIDLVVGLTLAALGIQQVSAQVIALPLKLLLFVATDGWRLLIEALIRGYV